MAATWLMPLHSKGRSKEKTLRLRTNYSMNEIKTTHKKLGIESTATLIATASYSQNPDKTNGGQLVRGYACDPRTVVEEFMLTKKEYEYKTGRSQGDRDIIAYRIRQSFVPGEIEPDKALDVGYELAMRWTKGKHAFIVSVHTDKAHIHCHIDYNSTRLDASGKFNNFNDSHKALRKLSDLICLEHGLSVINNPAQSKGKNYAKWMQEKYGGKEPSWQDKLRQKIDDLLPSCATFDEFLSAMQIDGYAIKTNRKHISVLAPGQKRPTRLSTLTGDHAEEAIRRRIEEYNQEREQQAQKKANKTTKETSASTMMSTTVKVSFLLDIQAKIQEGKGQGYEQWAHIFNIKEMARTLMYLHEQQIESFDELIEKSATASAQFTSISTEIKSIENRLDSISELQRQIGTYGKTREVYNAYKSSNFDSGFYEKNRASIALHEAARKHFDSLGVKKLPKISELKEEYVTLSTEKKKLYVSYHELKRTSRELAVAKHNAEKILGIELLDPHVQNHDVSRTDRRDDEPRI